MQISTDTSVVRSRLPQAAAIYTRISLDPSGERLGVQRQEEDCRAEATRRGWRVAEVYEDDDRSAFNPRRGRPEYERLLTDIRRGVRDGVMIWRLDRLHRQPRELEEFIVVCDKHDVALATVTGDVDLATSQGRLLARAWGAFAAHESEVRGERLSRAARQRATRGVMPHSGGLYGYDMHTNRVKPREAAVINEVATRLLRGESIYAICVDLNRRRIPSPRQRSWTHPTLRRLIVNPRLAGLSTYRGEVVGTGAWPAILRRPQLERLRALLDDPSRNLNVNPPRWYLLRRAALCAKCGAPVTGGAVRGVRHYQCVNRPNGHGCGRVVMRADRLEAAVLEAMCARLDTTELRTQLAANRANDVVWQRAQARYDATTQQLEVLAQDYARGFITRSEWLAVRPALLDQLASSKAVVDADRIEAVLGEFIGRSAQLAGSWATLDGNRRRAIVTALVEKVIVLPAPRAPCPASSRVVMWWRGGRKPRINARRLGGIDALRKGGAFDRCTVKGCKGQYLASGFCSLHYQRWYRLGDAGPLARYHHLPYNGAQCVERGCTRLARENERCPKHGQQLRSRRRHAKTP